MKQISLLIIFFIFSISAIAQKINENEEPTIFGHIAIGYYNPMAAGGTGNIVYTEIGMKAKNDFIIGIGFGLSDVFEEYDADPFFGGFRSYHNYYNYKLSISRRFEIGNNKNHIITIGSGFVYNQVKYSEPYVNLVPVSIDEYVLEVGNNRSDSMQNDFGSILSFNYGYKLQKIEIGLRVEAHLLLDIGLGGLILAPQISFAF